MVITLPQLITAAKTLNDWSKSQTTTQLINQHAEAINQQSQVITTLRHDLTQVQAKAHQDQLVGFGFWAFLAILFCLAVRYYDKRLKALEVKLASLPEHRVSDDSQNQQRHPVNQTAVL
jgi:hypothetical protein